MQRRTLCAALATLASRPGPVWATDGAVDETWLDAERNRALPLRLRWPAGDDACALVVHSHGLGGSREGGALWGEAWRAAGFAVLHLQHPGSDRGVLRQDGLAALRRAASAEQLLARVADVRFVLDEIERRIREVPSWGRVRRDRIGASGHSFGAQTVLALAGKRFAGAMPGRRDPSEPRLRAFVALSPALGRADARTPAEQLGAITRPLLAATGSLDGDPLGGALTGADRARVYDGLPSGRRGLLWLDGADHATFGGGAEGRRASRRATEALAREAAHHALVARLSARWWRAWLDDDAAALAALRDPAAAGIPLGPGDRWRMD